MGFINSLNYWKQWDILNKTSLFVTSKRSSLGEYETGLIFLELSALGYQGSIWWLLLFCGKPRAGVRLDKPISPCQRFTENVVSRVNKVVFLLLSLYILLFHSILFTQEFRLVPDSLYSQLWSWTPNSSPSLSQVLGLQLYAGLCGPWIKIPALYMLGSTKWVSSLVFKFSLRKHRHPSHLFRDHIFDG